MMSTSVHLRFSAVFIVFLTHLLNAPFRSFFYLNKQHLLFINTTYSKNFTCWPRPLLPRMFYMAWGSPCLGPECSYLSWVWLIWSAGAIQGRTDICCHHPEPKRCVFFQLPCRVHQGSSPALHGRTDLPQWGNGGSVDNLLHPEWRVFLRWWLGEYGPCTWLFFL